MDEGSEGSGASDMADFLDEAHGSSDESELPLPAAVQPEPEPEPELSKAAAGAAAAAGPDPDEKPVGLADVQEPEVLVNICSSLGPKDLGRLACVGRGFGGAVDWRRRNRDVDMQRFEELMRKVDAWSATRGVGRVQTTMSLTPADNDELERLSSVLFPDEGSEPETEPALGGTSQRVVSSSATEPAAATRSVVEETARRRVLSHLKGEPAAPLGCSWIRKLHDIDARKAGKQGAMRVLEKHPDETFAEFCARKATGDAYGSAAAAAQKATAQTKADARARQDEEHLAAAVIQRAAGDAAAAEFRAALKAGTVADIPEGAVFIVLNAGGTCDGYYRPCASRVSAGFEHCERPDEHGVVYKDDEMQWVVGMHCCDDSEGIGGIPDWCGMRGQPPTDGWPSGVRIVFVRDMNEHELRNMNEQ